MRPPDNTPLRRARHNGHGPRAVRASSALLAPLALLALVETGAALAACGVRTVDVGANDASASVPNASSLDGGLSRSAYGCAEFVDQDIASLRNGACGGQCSSVPGSPYDLDSKATVIAATVGQWMYCAGTLGPAEAIGVELAPGCRVFFLVKDVNGAVARGTEARFQATYDIYDPRPAGTPRRIDVHLNDGTTIAFDVDAYRCPEHLRLVSPESHIELSPGFGDSGRPDPVACLIHSSRKLL